MNLLFFCGLCKEADSKYTIDIFGKLLISNIFSKKMCVLLRRLFIIIIVFVIIIIIIFPKVPCIIFPQC